MKYKRLLVTGGAGFIGSAFIRYSLKNYPELEAIVNLDILTYAGNLDNLAEIAHDPRYHFVQGDIRNQALVQTLCEKYRIDAIVHCAAESHVDRSIANPELFLETNIRGTFALLEVARRLPHIHFHHVSTDEVYGSIEEGFFNELSIYRPNTPYAATKAASDHLVRAWAVTYGISTTISHCSNNYGPYQYPEKLIPRMVHACAERGKLTIHGNGLHIRDWLYVDDHAHALWLILEKGKRGEIYDIGGRAEHHNIHVVHAIIDSYAKATDTPLEELKSLITYIEDRQGNDIRYAIDSTKIEQELGWKQGHPFEEGLSATVNWYVEKLDVRKKEPAEEVEATPQQV
ncbi:MAG: dTDP-glucose 4,6-dehydratase [Verrucomicrobia bacterium]|nr:dTDP-glucose 4,6-dehydratase [Verrucomicrobiota bacterium]